MPTYTVIAQIKTRATPTSPATVESSAIFDRCGLHVARVAAQKWMRGALTDREVAEAVMSDPIPGTRTRYLTWTEGGTDHKEG